MVLVGLLVLAALFVWKSALPLVPPPRPALRGAPQAIAGRDSSEALANLLRRHVPPGRLLDDCLGEWRRACERGYVRQWSDAARRIAEVGKIVVREAAKPETERNPVATTRNPGGAGQR